MPARSRPRGEWSHMRSRSLSTVALTARVWPDLLSDLVVSGEVHYFRLDPTQWEDRLDKAAAMGVTAIATYIPWLVHELPDGSFDFGERHAHLDVARFIDLAAARGLAVIARPGPFVMAELKNEGLGHSVLREHPEIRVPGWDGVIRPETMVDYLHPEYLSACRRWYSAVIPILAERRSACGGNVVGIQLDNEIGMLQWVTNSPDLSDASVADLVTRLVAEEGSAAVRERYGIDLDDASAWVDAFRSPREDIVLSLHRDLGRQTRRRYARYVKTLAAWCRELGATDVPFLVNVHGCWAGRATMFPLGVSQLYETWADDVAMIPGTDYYIGDLTLDKLPGFWISNAFVAATTIEGQPTASLEFEVGSADYAESLAVSSGPEAAPLKLQMCLAQGNSLVNYYMLAGGRNPMLFEPVGDGNDRIASTGERHGFAAPIDPEGHRFPGYDLQTKVTLAVRDQSELLRSARAEIPPVAIGFVPDHYMTEYRYPASAREQAFVSELERFRGSGPGEVMARALVTGGFAPDAVNIQDSAIVLDRVLALAPTPYLDNDIQAKLVEWVRAGGKLLLHGPLPQWDMLGRPATTLIDALGIVVGQSTESSLRDVGYAATPQYTPFVKAATDSEGRLVWDIAEVAVSFAQPLDVGSDAEVLARLARTDEPCAVDVPLGKGRVVVLAADLPCLPTIWVDVFARLGASPAVTVDSSVPGVVVVPAVTPDGVRVTHVMNVSPWDAEVSLSRDGRALLPEPLPLPGRLGAWLVQRPEDPYARLAFTSAGSV